jgi:hypothetical protein
MARLKQVSEAQLEQEADKFRKDFLAEPGITLVRTPFDNPFVQLLWRQHYVGSKGTVGRQLHYLIYFDGVAVGAISAGSAMFAHKKRDRILGVSKPEQQAGVRHIVNNTMFRLIRPKDAMPRATDVLKVFRKVVIKDWITEYGDCVRAFETLVEPPRWGGIYKLDGWKKIGMTAGLGARRPEGHGTAGKSSTGVRKIIRVPKKIVWILPICSYEEALALSASTRKTSYGDDAIKISDFLKANPIAWHSSNEIAGGANVSTDRVKTLLYLMANADQSIERDDRGRCRWAAADNGGAKVRIYSRAEPEQLEFVCQPTNTTKS